jgi:hypothetical protein
MVKYQIMLSWLNYANQANTGFAYNSTTIIPNGEGQVVGTLGEIAFAQWLRDMEIDFEYCAKNSYDFDFIVAGRRIDIKTKKSKGIPQDSYTVRIPQSQREQDCDLYVFTYANDHDVYFLGFSAKKDYWKEIGFPVNSGDLTDNFTEKVDAQVAYVRDLNDMERLELILRNSN